MPPDSDRNRALRARGLAIALVLAAGLGVLSALAIPVAARSTPEVIDRAANLPDPVAQLALAEHTVPFTIHLPTPTPNGAIPLTVDTDIEGQVASFDMWWTLPGSSRLHIWETNNPGLATEGKDVLASGIPVSVNGVRWQQTRTNWDTVTLTELCSRFPDGVIVCVASDLDPAWVSSVASTIS